MDWEIRGESYFARRGQTEYMVRIKAPTGWGRYSRTVGDDRWELQNIYASARAAMDTA